MGTLYNIYCDESCHLPNDNSNVMVLGAITCPANMKKKVYEDLRTIKKKHEVNPVVEVKWTKLGKAKIDLYKELIEYFFNNEFLSFRGLIVKNKELIDNEKYNNGDGNLFYYKMYFYLLDKICYFDNQYRIFVDVKDTNGGPRLKKLQEVLCNNKYDFKRDIITEITQVNSNRSDIMQLTDLLIGILSFYHRGLFFDPKRSIYKKMMVENIINRVGYKTLNEGTPPYEHKFNIFVLTLRG